MSTQKAFDPFDLSASQEDWDTSRSGSVNITPRNASSTNAHDVNSNPSMDSNDSFDPFGIATLSQTPNAGIRSASDDPPTRRPREDSPSTPPEVNRVTRQSVPVTALPPKLVLKLTMYEEVSSQARIEADGTLSSNAAIEGSVYAQVQCSDGRKNAPFALATVDPDFSVRPNQKFLWNDATMNNNAFAVHIPKPELGYVPVAHYSLTKEVQHLPVLLERKVTVQDTSCRLAVQVRSKLTNSGDIEDLTIVVAVPERVNGDSIEISRGEGVWDELKRTIQWKLKALETGQSFMVSAHAKLWKPAQEDDDIRFPVVLRCSSAADLISTAAFEVTPVEGYPAHLSTTRVKSFRLLHRLT
jgi:hypothetical protein